MLWPGGARRSAVRQRDRTRHRRHRSHHRGQLPRRGGRLYPRTSPALVGVGHRLFPFIGGSDSR
jgi:hypothetical protein